MMPAVEIAVGRRVGDGNGKEGYDQHRELHRGD